MRALSALMLLVALPAIADDATLLVVTDLEARGATELQATAATGSVVRGLRNLNAFQVLAADEVRQLLALERSRQLLGEEVETGEVSAASKALGARYLVTGTVSRPEARLVVDLQLLDTTDGKVLSQKSLGPVASVETVAQELPGLAQELVAPLLEAEQGGLLVRTNEEGVEVWIDDVLRASTPMAQPIRFARGMHRVTVKKDGFIAQSRSTELRRDEVTVEAFTLVASPDFARAYAEHHGRQRRMAWFAAGLAVVTIGGAIGLDQLYTGPTWSQELNPRNLALSAPDADTVRRANLNQAQAETYRRCVADRPGCYQRAQEVSSRVQTAQLVSIGLGAVGAVSAIASTWFFVSGNDPHRYSGLVAGVDVQVSPFGVAFSGSF